MSIEYLIMVFSFLGFGLLSSGGVFTVFVTVGIVPRFADKTHTANSIIVYENSIVAGTILGCVFSVYPEFFTKIIGQAGLEYIRLWECFSSWILGFFGLEWHLVLNMYLVV